MEAHNALRGVPERGHAVQGTRDHHGRGVRSVRSVRRPKGTNGRLVGAVTDAYKRSRLPWFIDVTGLPTAALVDDNDRTKIVIIRETPVRFRLFTGARVPFFCFPFRVLS